MSHPLIAWLQSPAWVAGATQEIRTDRLPSTLDGLPCHIVSLDCKVELTVNDGGEQAEPGEHLFNALAHLRIRDVVGNEILRLRGRHLRNLMKLCRGWQHDDPADLPGNDSGSLTRTLEFSIPFHGRHGGVLGSRAYDDYWLPVDRIRGVPIEVEWAPAAVFDNAGDITDAVLYINPVLMPYRSVVVGADIRWHYLDMAPSAAVHMPLRGKALHSAGIMANTGEYSHPAATWTQFSLEEFSFLSRVTLPQLVGAWNSRCAQCVPEHEPIADPQFIPIVFQDKRGSVTGLPMFPLGRVELNVTSTETETWEMIMAEVFDTQDLAQKLMGRPQTVFQGARRAVAKYSEKNQPGRQGRGTGPSSRVATRLNHLLAHQLRG